MSSTADPDELHAIDLARECLYRFLAAALSDPLGCRWDLLRDEETQHLARGAAQLLHSEFANTGSPLGFGELPIGQLDLDPVLTELRQPLDFLRSECERIFGLVHARECPPYETEYHTTAEASFRSQQLADIAGFYRAFGLETAHMAPERPDHIALELEFMAFLLMKKRLATGSDERTAGEQAHVCGEAQQHFFRDHLAWWVPSFSAGLRRKAEDGFYAAVAQVLAAFLPVERARCDVPAPRLPLQPVPIERPEEQPECLGCAVGG